MEALPPGVTVQSQPLDATGWTVCPAGTYGDDRETLIAGIYSELRPTVHNVYLSDVNADGLSDVLQVRFDAVDAYSSNPSGKCWLSNILF